MGLHRPSRRPTAGDWERALARTVDMLHPTPGGLDWQVLGPGLPMNCPATGVPFAVPIPCATFHRRSPHSRDEFLPEPSGHCLTIYNGLHLMPCHIFAALQSEELHPVPQGYFVCDKDTWYLVSESDETMFVDGSQPLRRNGFVEIKDGLSMVMSSQPNARVLRFKFLRPQAPASLGRRPASALSS